MNAQIDNLIVQDGIHINEFVLETERETELYKDLLFIHHFDKYVLNVDGVAVFEDSTNNGFDMLPIISNDETIEIKEDVVNCKVGLCVDTNNAKGKFEFAKKFPYLGFTGFTYIIINHDESPSSSIDLKLNIKNDNDIVIEDTHFTGVLGGYKATLTDIVLNPYTSSTSYSDRWAVFDTQEMIVVSYNPDKQEIYVYKNNELMRTTLMPSTIKDWGNFSQDFLQFDKNQNIDEVLFWTRPLTDFEINTIFNDGNFIDVEHWISTQEDRSFSTILNTELYDYLYYETYDYDDNSLLTNTHYDYLGNSDEIYIKDNSMIFNVSSDNIPYFKYDILEDNFEVPSYAKLQIHFNLKNQSYIDDSLIGKPAIFKFSHYDEFNNAYIDFNIGFDRYDDTTFQGLFYYDDNGIQNTYLTEFIKSNENIIVDVVINYVTSDYTIKFFDSENAFLGEFGGVTRDFEFITKDLGYFEFGRLDYNINVSASEYISVDAITYNLFDQDLGFTDNDFIDDSLNEISEPVTDEDSVVKSWISESVKNAISSMGFKGEVGRLLFVFGFIVLTLFAIANIKTEMMDFKTKSIMMVFTTFLSIIVGWKLELITTTLFTFIIFGVAVLGAILLRQLFSGNGE